MDVPDEKSETLTLDDLLKKDQVQGSQVLNCDFVKYVLIIFTIFIGVPKVFAQLPQFGTINQLLLLGEI